MLWFFNPKPSNCAYIYNPGVYIRISYPRGFATIWYCKHIYIYFLWKSTIHGYNCDTAWTKTCSSAPPKNRITKEFCFTPWLTYLNSDLRLYHWLSWTTQPSSCGMGKLAPCGDRWSFEKTSTIRVWHFPRISCIQSYSIHLYKVNIWYW